MNGGFIIIMKTKSKIYLQWLEAAYHEFATTGPEFSLKALANKTGLPRATLYYHFHDKDDLITTLLEWHEKNIDAYLQDLKNEVKNLIPDVYQLMFRYKEGILFHHQLLKHCSNADFCALYRRANDKSLQILLPLIKTQFASTSSDLDLIKFYHTLTDAWYTRLDTNNFTVESMIALAQSILENTMGLFKPA